MKKSNVLLIALISFGFFFIITGSILVLSVVIFGNEFLVILGASFVGLGVICYVITFILFLIQRRKSKNE